MDTPSLKSLSLVCKCGASLTHTDFAFRVDVAEDEFRAQHVTAFCGVSVRPDLPPGFRRETRFGQPIIVGPPARVPAISRTKKGED